MSSGSLVPDVVKAVRLAVTSGNTTTYHEAKCPGTVVLPMRAGIGGLKCTFNVPVPKGNTGTVQAQASHPGGAAALGQAARLGCLLGPPSR